MSDQAVHFSAAEMEQMQASLHDYAPAHNAMETLEQHGGNVTTSLEAVLVETYGAPAELGRPSLWEVTRETLRQEICEDDGFLGRVKAYTEQPEQAGLLTALIVYLVEQVSLPFTISPSLATLVVLYIVKVGLTIFCKYTEPQSER